MVTVIIRTILLLFINVQHILNVMIMSIGGAGRSSNKKRMCMNVCVTKGIIYTIRKRTQKLYTILFVCLLRSRELITKSFNKKRL